MGLQQYVDAWIDAVRAVEALELTEHDGEAPTSLPGWRVRDILAHLVHLEEVIAFGEGDEGTDPVSSVTSAYTQAGVDALDGVPVAELRARLAAAAAERASQLHPLPADPAAPADRAPGGTGWDWSTLLRNRALDLWMHEQDIRRALDRPGNLGAPGAHVSVRSLSAALPFIVGKRAAAPAGHPVRFEVEGEVPFTRTVAVGADGRASDTDENPLTTIAMSSETFARLAGGREPLETFEVRVTGDRELAARVLAGLAVTP